MTTATRAPKGGTVGINGLQYAGGTFLPSTKLGKMQRAEVTASVKVVSILDGIKAFVAVSFDKSFCKITANDHAIAYYGKTRQEIQSIVDRYNAGER
jgi:hypothetical protein